MNNAYPSGDRSHDDGEEDHTISDDHSEMPPLVRQQFRQREGSKLAISRAESDQSVCYDRLPDSVRSPSDNGSDKDEYVAEKDEVSSAKKITGRDLAKWSLGL